MLAVAGALLVAGAGAVLVNDLVALAARPAVLPPAAAAGVLETLRGLPDPSPLVVAIVVPAAVLLGLGLLLAALAAGASRQTASDAGTIRLVDRTAAGLRIGYGVLFGVVALLALLSPVAAVGGYEITTLTSGSMRPAYPAGSLLLLEHVPADQLAVGDVVSVRRPELDAIVTHRIVDIERTPLGLRLQTRGDAAPAPDPGWTTAEALEGRVVTGVRALGGLRAWVISPLGLLAFGLLMVIMIEGIEALQAVGIAGRAPGPPPSSNPPRTDAAG